MPYSVTWHRPDTILYLKMMGDVSVEDAEGMANDAFERVKAADGLVHAIVDTAEVSSVPLSLKTLSSNVTRNNHPNQGYTILLSKSLPPIVRFLGTTVIQMGNWNYKMADSVEDAEIMLEALDQTLSPISPKE